MEIVLLEPFYTGSHRTWADSLSYFSKHNFRVLSMEGRYWKWRMKGGAVTLAKAFQALPEKPDMILATDMLDLSTFLGLNKAITASIPVALYFHENQMAYPSEKAEGKRNDWRHYAFINYISALSATKVFFNSSFNLESFSDGAYQILKSYRDYNELETLDIIRQKSSILPLGLNLKRFDPYLHNGKESQALPLILWNHRWEKDKNPEEFAKLLLELHREGFQFQVALLGEAPYGNIKAFDDLKASLGDQVVAFGYAESFEDYAGWLAKADIIPVTSNQDFFGASVVEAIYCGCYPILPNKLAYPDHLPKGEGQHLLYESYQELFEKTKAALANIERVRTLSFQEWVSEYDWESIIQEYDRSFEALIY